MDCKRRHRDDLINRPRSGFRTDRTCGLYYTCHPGAFSQFLGPNHSLFCQTLGTFQPHILDDHGRLDPVFGAKKYGGSKSGVWCSVLGMVLGVFFFPPWGMLIGAFTGAIAGEWLAGKEGRESPQAAWGVFIGNVVGIGLKLAFCGVILFFYVKALF